MKKIYKYPLNDPGITMIKAPLVQLLDVKYQPGIGIVVWGLIDDEIEDIQFCICGIGTGWPIDEEISGWKYIGTEIDEEGYVWHFFSNYFDKMLERAELKDKEEFDLDEYLNRFGLETVKN